MTILMDAPVQGMQVSEATIDLEAMTWTCTEHNETMRIQDGSECPQCAPTYPDPVEDNWTG